MRLSGWDYNHSLLALLNVISDTLRGACDGFTIPVTGRLPVDAAPLAMGIEAACLIVPCYERNVKASGSRTVQRRYDRHLAVLQHGTHLPRTFC